VEVAEEIIVHPVAGEAVVHILPQVGVVPDPAGVAGDNSQRYYNKRPGKKPGLYFKTTPYMDKASRGSLIDNPFAPKIFQSPKRIDFADP
jgi:hypothetical protein